MKAFIDCRVSVDGFSASVNRLSWSALLGAIALGVAAFGCSASGGGESNVYVGATGGGAAEAGTSSGTGGAGVADSSAGGSVQSAGGTVQSAGGTQQNTGGSVQSAGGTQQNTGGTQQNTGGSVQSTGGFSFGGFSTGGSVQSTGGTAQSTGGTAQSTGGTSTGTGGTSSTVDPNAAEQISACIDSLPWGQSNIQDRNEVINAIINTCVEFAPPGDEWQTYCQMFLASAINKESSYQAGLIVEDSYGGSTDPTVGLTQIRFSSTVSDFNDGGPIDTIERIGCDWPTINSGDGYAQHAAMMTDVTCNIALGAWYYFVYATGNGGSSVVYLYQYCQGQGVAANLVIGMLSHLRGPSGAVGGGSDPYVDQIREWFDECLRVNNIQVSGTHPFELTLQPEPDKYCA
jgi:hypothetical protein